MSQQFPPAFVRNDGYNEQGFIKGVPGLHCDCRFTFRRMNNLRLGQLQSGVRKCESQDLSNKLQAQTIVQFNHLLSWDVVDEKKAAVEISVDNLLKGLHPNLFSGIVGIITGMQPSDIDNAPEHLRESTEQDLVALFGIGQEEPAAPEVADEKNSATG